MRIELRESASRLPDEVAVLVTASMEEGYAFVARLFREWGSGDNRFDKPGEVLFLAYHGPDVVGVCGLNRDPFAGSSKIGRVRRLYVLPGFRGLGIARRLVDAVVEHGRGHFELIRVRAGTPSVSDFYHRIGFRALDDADATHAIHVRPG
jgi:GNAT superfamily N-acetyltransferase